MDRPLADLIREARDIIAAAKAALDLLVANGLVIDLDQLYGIPTPGTTVRVRIASTPVTPLKKECVMSDETLQAMCQKFADDCCKAPTILPQGPDTEAFGDRIKQLIELLKENFKNISEDEAKAIMAQVAVATAAFASGNWLGGAFALMKAFQMYRAAIVS
jgi:hypothetical protein